MSEGDEYLSPELVVGVTGLQAGMVLGGHSEGLDRLVLVTFEGVRVSSGEKVEIPSLLLNRSAVAALQVDLMRAAHEAWGRESLIEDVAEQLGVDPEARQRARAQVDAAIKRALEE